MIRTLFLNSFRKWRNIGATRFACIHFCPEEAIQIEGRNTTGKGRYHNLKIDFMDIAQQKRVNQ